MPWVHNTCAGASAVVPLTIRSRKPMKWAVGFCPGSVTITGDWYGAAQAPMASVPRSPIEPNSGRNTLRRPGGAGAVECGDDHVGVHHITKGRIEGGQRRLVLGLAHRRVAVAHHDGTEIGHVGV